MSAEEVISLRHEKQGLQEQVGVQQERVDGQQAVIERQQKVIEGLQKQMALLTEQVQALQERLKKDSHNSHLPPSSNRFHRQPKSLRQKSGKKPGRQAGHPGSTLLLSPTPDQVIVYPVESCQHCQADLREVEQAIDSSDADLASLAAQALQRLLKSTPPRTAQ